MNIFKNGYFLIFIGCIPMGMAVFLIDNDVIKYTFASIGFVICAIGVLLPANMAPQKQISDIK